MKIAHKRIVELGRKNEAQKIASLPTDPDMLKEMGRREAQRQLSIIQGSPAPKRKVSNHPGTPVKKITSQTSSSHGTPLRQTLMKPNSSGRNLNNRSSLLSSLNLNNRKASLCVPNLDNEKVSSSDLSLDNQKATLSDLKLDNQKALSSGLSLDNGKASSKDLSKELEDCREEKF
ncbi:hypothetical protein OCU04_011090 [Sclerotinia nivalis]|uniref:Uncharacterized protein n=1 Tax=Sclerotinia nivalis TaxID=352851 RepID=A0A9X0AEB7_9HELO|nr:hypothetical protein OCU04_011090 [Sclerotinia nivalis]